MDRSVMDGLAGVAAGAGSDVGRMRDAIPDKMGPPGKRSLWHRLMFGEPSRTADGKSNNKPSVLEKSYKPAGGRKNEVVQLRGRIESMEGWTGQITDRLGDVEAAVKEFKRLGAVASLWQAPRISMPPEFSEEEAQAFRTAWNKAASAQPGQAVHLIPSDEVALLRLTTALTMLADDVTPELLALPIPVAVRAVLMGLLDLARPKDGPTLDQEGAS